MHIITAKTTNKKTGAIYINHKLVESVRTAKGPRNRIIMNLGNLDSPAETEYYSLIS